MTDMQSNQTTAAPDGGAANDRLAEIIQAAGRREAPSQEHRDRVYAVAHAAWQQKLAQRRRRRVGWASAIAASLAVAIFTAVVVLPGGDSQLVAVRVDRVNGVGEWRTAAGRWQPLQIDSARMEPGIQIRSGEESAIGLLMPDGTSVRLAADTSISFGDPGSIALRHGKLYVDSGSAPAGAQRSLQVTTPIGTATDIGTQFEIVYDDDSYRLRVREGKVLTAMADSELLTAEGDELTIGTDGAMRQSTVEPTDPDWEWIEGVVPMPDVDGKPLAVLLEWVVRETRRPVTYEKPALELQAEQTILHGRISNLKPLQTLGVMLATTNMRYELRDDGSILIYARQQRQQPAND